jgi:uncharacterized protein YcbK (DUF882 family)
MKLTKHFTLHEFRCRCGCKAEEAWVEAIRKTAEILELLRERINSKQEYIKYRKLLDNGSFRELPIVIMSGVRCPEHNEKVGGVTGSKHLSTAYEGAADTTVPGLPSELWYAETEGLFRGRILYTKKNFVHVDRRAGNTYSNIREA